MYIACQTLACLALHLGGGNIVLKADNGFIYRNTLQQVRYLCLGRNDFYECAPLEGPNAQPLEQTMYRRY